MHYAGLWAVINFNGDYTGGGIDYIDVRSEDLGIRLASFGRFSQRHRHDPESAGK
jgi:hypothetical protein